MSLLAALFKPLSTSSNLWLKHSPVCPAPGNTPRPIMASTLRIDPFAATYNPHKPPLFVQQLIPHNPSVDCS
jgi:hypothetical protein